MNATKAKRKKQIFAFHVDNTIAEDLKQNLDASQKKLPHEAYQSIITAISKAEKSITAGNNVRNQFNAIADINNVLMNVQYEVIFSSGDLGSVKILLGSIIEFLLKIVFLGDAPVRVKKQIVAILQRLTNNEATTMLPLVLQKLEDRIVHIISRKDVKKVYGKNTKWSDLVMTTFRFIDQPNLQAVLESHALELLGCYFKVQDQLAKKVSRAVNATLAPGEITSENDFKQAADIQQLFSSIDRDAPLEALQERLVKLQGKCIISFLDSQKVVHALVKEREKALPVVDGGINTIVKLLKMYANGDLSKVCMKSNTRVLARLLCLLDALHTQEDSNAGKLANTLAEALYSSSQFPFYKQELKEFLQSLQREKRWCPLRIHISLVASIIECCPFSVLTCRLDNFGGKNLVELSLKTYDLVSPFTEESDDLHQVSQTDLAVHSIPQEWLKKLKKLLNTNADQDQIKLSVTDATTMQHIANIVAKSVGTLWASETLELYLDTYALAVQKFGNQNASITQSVQAVVQTLVASVFAAKGIVKEKYAMLSVVVPKFGALKLLENSENHFVEQLFADCVSTAISSPEMYAVHEFFQKFVTQCKAEAQEDTNWHQQLLKPLKEAIIGQNCSFEHLRTIVQRVLPLIMNNVPKLLVHLFVVVQEHVKASRTKMIEDHAKLTLGTTEYTRAYSNYGQQLMTWVYILSVMKKKIYRKEDTEAMRRSRSKKRQRSRDATRIIGASAHNPDVLIVSYEGILEEVSNQMMEDALTHATLDVVRLKSMELLCNLAIGDEQRILFPALKLLKKFLPLQWALATEYIGMDHIENELGLYNNTLQDFVRILDKWTTRVLVVYNTLWKKSTKALAKKQQLNIPEEEEEEEDAQTPNKPLRADKLFPLFQEFAQWYIENALFGPLSPSCPSSDQVATTLKMLEGAFTAYVLITLCPERLGKVPGTQTPSTKRVEKMFPGQSSNTARSTLQQATALLAEGNSALWNNESPLMKDLFSEKHVTILLNGLQENYNYNRQYAFEILMKFPTPLPGITTKEQLDKLMLWATAFTGSTYMNEADSGALIVNLLFQKYCHRLQWVLNIPLQRTITKLDDLEKYPELHFVKQLISILEYQYQSALEDFDAAADKTPMHCIVSSLRYIFDFLIEQKLITNASTELKQHWKQTIAEVLNLVMEVCKFCIKYLSYKNFCPGIEISEANIEESEDTYHSSTTPYHRKSVSTCCWVNSKEISHLMAVLIHLFENTDQDLLDKNQVNQICEGLFHIMLNTTHTGVLETTFYSMKKFCNHLWDVNYREKLYEWVDYMINLMQNYQNEATLTTRSAGLPYCYLALLLSPPLHDPNPILNFALNKLFQVANENLAKQNIKEVIHILNVMHAVFRDSTLGDKITNSIIEKAFIFCMNCAKVSNWKAKSASNMLYGILLMKCKVDSISASQFFGRFSPNVANFMLGACESPSSRKEEDLVPLLLLFARFLPSNEPPSGFLASVLERFGTVFEQCCDMRPCQERMLAARAFANTVNTKNAKEVLLRLLHKIPNAYTSQRNNNELHGTLLKIRNLLATHFAVGNKDGSIGLEVFPQLYTKQWLLDHTLLHTNKIHPFVSTVYLEIINQFVAGDSQPVSQQLVKAVSEMTMQLLDTSDKLSAQYHAPFALLLEQAAALSMNSTPQHSHIMKLLSHTDYEVRLVVLKHLIAAEASSVGEVVEAVLTILDKEENPLVVNKALKLLPKALKQSKLHKCELGPLWKLLNRLLNKFHLHSLIKNLLAAFGVVLDHFKSQVTQEVLGQYIHILDQFSQESQPPEVQSGALASIQRSNILVWTLDGQNLKDLNLQMLLWNVVLRFLHNADMELKVATSMTVDSVFFGGRFKERSSSFKILFNDQRGSFLEVIYAHILDSFEGHYDQLLHYLFACVRGLPDERVNLNLEWIQQGTYEDSKELGRIGMETDPITAVNLCAKCVDHIIQSSSENNQGLRQHYRGLFEEDLHQYCNNLIHEENAMYSVVNSSIFLGIYRSLLGIKLTKDNSYKLPSELDNLFNNMSRKLALIHPTLISLYKQLQ